MIKPASVSPVPVSRHNLPAEVATFIGRESDIAHLKGMLEQTRLLTLTGAGGSGKTRLALRVAANTAQTFPDGVWLVQLAAVADSRLVTRTVATVLEVRGMAGRPLLATLATALASRRLLLVLDNCEHLVGACARLAETLLGACPQLRILATSREPLRVPGEVTWRVCPLALPNDPLPSLESLAQIEAVALFLDRARAHLPGFTLTTENAPYVAVICRRLDGLPLTIELAAAQTRWLSPAQIADRLASALSILDGGSRTLPRQETLRAALDWSHDLLSDTEKIVFRRLAVFAGGFDLEAAEAVCEGDGVEPGTVPNLLGTLVEKSLVEPQVQTWEARYRLLEPVRQYAWEHLERGGEVEGIERRHALHFLALTERAEQKLMSGERGPWMERLSREQDNLRRALAWSRNGRVAGDIEVGLRLSAALTFYWSLRGETGEGLDWVETFLARGRDAGAEVRAKALYAAAELAWVAGQVDLARARAEESEARWRVLGNRRWLAYTLQSQPMAIDHPRSRDAVEESLKLFEEVGDEWGFALAMGAVDLFALILKGDPSGHGQARLEEAVRRFQDVGDDWARAQMLNLLGDLARSQGDDASATARYEESLLLLRRQGMTGSVPSLLQNLGYLAVRRGEVRRALRLLRESLMLFRDRGDQRGVADCLDGLAGVLSAMKNAEPAVRLLGAAEALREAIGASVWPANAADYERILATLRSLLDEAALCSAWAAGRKLSLQQAVAEALAAEPSSDGRSGIDGFDLTTREGEVVVLVAQGLTNRQIGAALFITEETARLHVKHILHKLGFASRAQIAAWAVEQGLVAAPKTI